MSSSLRPTKPRDEAGSSFRELCQPRKAATLSYPASLAVNGASPTSVGPMQKELEVRANRFRYTSESGVGIYDGDVQVSGTNLALSCGSAEVRVPTALRGLESIRATQNVVMDYDL